MRSGSTKAVFGLVALVLGTAGACSSKMQTRGGSETNWLAMCTHDSECSAGRCLCGLCTESCADATGCPSGSGLDMCATTDMAALSALCGDQAAPKGVCLKGCDSDVVCARGFICDSGACVPAARARADAGSGAGGTGSDGTTGNTGGAGQGATGSGASTGAGTSTPTTASIFIDQVFVEQGADGLPQKCFPRTLPVDGNGQVACRMVAIQSGQASCQCDAPGYRPLVGDELSSAKERLRETLVCDVSGKPSCDSLCGCAVQQESGVDLEKCLTSVDVQGVAPGFCYLDLLTNPGSAPVLADCPLTQKRTVRVLGPAQGQILMMECTIISASAAEAFNATPGNLGDPCIPGDEYNKNFSGYIETEVNVETGAPSCTTGVCLTANFRGRVSCPYGQPPAQSPDPVTGKILADPNTPAEDRCYVPGAPHVPQNLIDVPVEPQLTARLPDKAVYCSCRCDGPAGTGPFCDCPSGFQCQKLVDAYGTAGGAQFAGSYCIKAGTAVVDPTQIPPAKCGANPATKNQPPPIGCGTSPGSAPIRIGNDGG